jgi:hypothetical protein
MKNIFTILLLVLIALIFTTGCSSDDDSNPTEPNNNNQPGELTSVGGQPVPTGIASENFNGVMATVAYDFQTLPSLPAVTLTLAFASFGEGVDAGAVSVNNNDVGKMSESGTTFYTSPSPTNPTATLSGVNFNGSAHSWSVAGGNGIPALSGSVNSPTQFNLTSPANNATVSKSNGFDVTWTAGGTGGSEVLVMIIDMSSSDDVFAVDGLDDDGSYSVSASSLSNISGEAMLQVVKYTYSGLNSGGKDYYIISEIVKSVTINVN